MSKLTVATLFSLGFVTLFSLGTAPWPAFVESLWITVCLAVTVAFAAPLPRILREAKAARAIPEAETAEIIARTTLLEVEIEARIAALDRKTALIDIETTAIRAWSEAQAPISPDR